MNITMKQTSTTLFLALFKISFDFTHLYSGLNYFCQAQPSFSWRWPPLKMTSMEYDLDWRWPQWTMTSMEDYLNGRWPQWKTTSMEDNLDGRQLQCKTTLKEDSLNGRRPQAILDKPEVNLLIFISSPFSLINFADT